MSYGFKLELAALVVDDELPEHPQHVHADHQRRRLGEPPDLEYVQVAESDRHVHEVRLADRDLRRTEVGARTHVRRRAEHGDVDLVVVARTLEQCGAQRHVAERVLGAGVDDHLHRHLADLALHEQQAAFAQARRHHEHVLLGTSPGGWDDHDSIVLEVDLYPGCLQSVDTKDAVRAAEHGPRQHGQVHRRQLHVAGPQALDPHGLEHSRSRDAVDLDLRVAGALQPELFSHARRQRGRVRPGIEYEAVRPGTVDGHRCMNPPGAVRARRRCVQRLRRRELALRRRQGYGRHLQFLRPGLAGKQRKRGARGTGSNGEATASRCRERIRHVCRHTSYDLAPWAEFRRGVRRVAAARSCWSERCIQACTGSSVLLRTVRSAKLDCTRATPGRRVRCWLCSRSKSAGSDTTTRSR